MAHQKELAKGLSRSLRKESQIHKDAKLARLTLAFESGARIGGMKKSDFMRINADQDAWKVTLRLSAAG